MKKGLLLTNKLSTTTNADKTVPLLLLCSQGLWSQSYLSIQNDNDFYFNKDYYYSNGLFLHYGNQNPTRENTFTHFTLGQEIYNPSFRYITDTSLYDYPYSGWLYLNVKREVVNNLKGHSFSLKVGVTGDASQAKQLQNWYHNTFLNLNSLAWIDAMPQKLLVNIKYEFQKEKTINSLLRMGFKLEAQLGTQQTYIGQTSYGVINGMSLFDYDNPIKTKGTYWGIIFAYEKRYFAHDFMIDGPLDQSNAFELPIKRYRYILQAGPIIKGNKWLFKSIFNYRSRDNQNQRHSYHPYFNVTISRFWD